jgi:hypothetical protein
LTRKRNRKCRFAIICEGIVGYRFLVTYLPILYVAIVYVVTHLFGRFMWDIGDVWDGSRLGFSSIL